MSDQKQVSGHWNKRLLKRALGLVVVAIILTLLGINLAKSWKALSGYHWQASAPLLALAFVGFMLQTLSYPLVWRLTLRRLGYALSLPKSVRIYLASEFVRYLPGNVWHVITRILWAEREGIPKPIGFISMTVELVTKLASAALVFAITLLFWPRIDVLGSAIGGQTIVILGLAAIPVLLGLLQPRLLVWLLNRALKIMHKPAISLPMRYRDVLVIVLWWVVSWTIGGVAFYLLVVGVAGTGPGTASPAGASALMLVLSIGIAALGWDIGFLSFITPSGLGFREAAAALLLSLSLVVPSLALGTVIAFLWRILATLAELLCVGGAHLIVSRLERRFAQQSAATKTIEEAGALAD
jgi:uncharacterized membrane protein YbhN (UPF0104 family)